jgi:hypothetical protein
MVINYIDKNLYYENTIAIGVTTEEEWSKKRSYPFDGFNTDTQTYIGVIYFEHNDTVIYRYPKQAHDINRKALIILPQLTYIAKAYINLTKIECITNLIGKRIKSV